MNDITALAQREMEQREKFEAWTEESCALPWGYLKKRRTYDGFYSEHTYTSLWAAWKAASMALVEALESGDTENERMARDLISRNGEIEGLRKRVEELEEVATDYGMKFQRAQDDLKKMALMHRDESRTVTVKLPNPLMPAQHNSGELFMTSDNVRHGGYLNRDDVLRNLRAAGIQVIEGEQKNG